MFFESAVQSFLSQVSPTEARTSTNSVCRERLIVWGLGLDHALASVPNESSRILWQNFSVHPPCTSMVSLWVLLGNSSTSVWISHRWSVSPASKVVVIGLTLTPTISDCKSLWRSFYSIIKAALRMLVCNSEFWAIIMSSFNSFRFNSKLRFKATGYYFPEPSPGVCIFGKSYHLSLIYSKPFHPTHVWWIWYSNISHIWWILSYEYDIRIFHMSGEYVWWIWYSDTSQCKVNKKSPPGEMRIRHPHREKDTIKFLWVLFRPLPWSWRARVKSKSIPYILSPSVVDACPLRRCIECISVIPIETSRSHAWTWTPDTPRVFWENLSSPQTISWRVALHAQLVHTTTTLPASQEAIPNRPQEHQPPPISKRRWWQPLLQVSHYNAWVRRNKKLSKWWHSLHESLHKESAQRCQISEDKSLVEVPLLSKSWHCNHYTEKLPCKALAWQNTCFTKCFFLQALLNKALGWQNACWKQVFAQSSTCSWTNICSVEYLATDCFFFTALDYQSACS